MRITGLPYRDSPTRWRIVRSIVLKRDEYRCRKCGKAGVLECDHVTPIHQGGEPWDYGEPYKHSAVNEAVILRKTADENRARHEPTPTKKAWTNLVRELQ